MPSDPHNPNWQSLSLMTAWSARTLGLMVHFGRRFVLVLVSTVAKSGGSFVRMLNECVGSDETVHIWVIIGFDIARDRHIGYVAVRVMLDIITLLKVAYHQCHPFRQKTSLPQRAGCRNQNYWQQTSSSGCGDWWLATSSCSQNISIVFGSPGIVRKYWAMKD